MNNQYQELMSIAFQDESLEGIIWKWGYNPVTFSPEKMPNVGTWKPTEEQIQEVNESPERLKEYASYAMDVASYSPNTPSEDGIDMCWYRMFPDEYSSFIESEHERLLKMMQERYGDPELDLESLVSCYNEDIEYDREDTLLMITKKIGADSIAQYHIDGIERTGKKWFGYCEYWDISNNCIWDTDIPLGISQHLVDKYNELQK
jgi:hypothetical protein